MPNITHQVPDTYSSIMRPMAITVARDLMKLMGLPRDTLLQFAGAAETVAQGGVVIGEPDDSPVRFPFSGKVTLEVSEREIEDRVLTQAVKQDEAVYVFWDSALRVSIKPIYVGTEVTLSLRYRARDRVEAEQWRDEFRHRTAQGRKELLHEAAYHYGFPDAFLVILHEIYTMRENVAPYGETLKDWLQNHTSEKVTRLVNQAGELPHIVVGETQIQLLGWFDFIAQPEQPTKTDAGATWEAGFDYIFNYDKPIALNMRYPLLVHNQLLDVKFRPSEPVYQLGRRARYPSYTRFLLDQFTGKYMLPDYSDTSGGVMIPAFDEWYPSYVPPSTAGLLYALCQVDLQNPTAIVNFGELGEYEFDPDVLEFLKIEAPFMGTLYNSIFHLSLFLWNEPLYDGAILVNPVTLDVTSRIPMDPRQMYHMRLGLITKLSLLTPAAIDRLRDHGPAAIKVIQALDPTVVVDKYLGGTIIPRKTIDQIIKQVDNVNNAVPGSQGYNLYTVGVYGIIAHKGALNADH